MKFPITRESLRTYDYKTELEELRKEEIEKCFTVALNYLCDDFRKHIRSNPKDTRFVWHKLQTYHRSFRIEGLLTQEVFDLTSDKHLYRFVDTLKELFIGCDIIVDPLKTYVIIDWL